MSLTLVGRVLQLRVKNPRMQTPQRGAYIDDTADPPDIVVDLLVTDFADVAPGEPFDDDRTKYLLLDPVGGRQKISITRYAEDKLLSGETAEILTSAGRTIRVTLVGTLVG